jgi:hypothetical protein
LEPVKAEQIVDPGPSSDIAGGAPKKSRAA